MERQEYFGLRDGYVETLYGKRIPLPIDMGEKHCRNCAINYPVQGTAAEIFKRTLIETAKAGLLEFILLLVHDELDFDRRVQLPEGLESISPVKIPIEEDYDSDRWG